MPRSRSYSRSPSKNTTKKSSRRSRSRDRSREKYGSSSRRRSKSRSRSKKVSSRYKTSPSRRRSRSGDRRRKSKYYSSSKKDYRRERSRTRERERYTKRRSRSSSDSRSSNSSYSASSSSTVASKVSVKSEKEIQMIPLKMPSHQPVVPTKNTLQFSSIDLVGDFVKPEIIEELNTDEFVPKHFQSGGGKKHLPDNIKIDLNSESISVTTKTEDNDKKDDNLDEENSIFHPNLFGDEAVRMDKWVRKLYLYRQKMFLSEN